MLAVFVFGLVLTVAAGRLGTALVGRARAETAADAAALAAADQLALGRGSAAAAAAARETAASNGAELSSCRCEGNAAEVVVELDLGLLGTARGRAKAAVELRCVFGLPGCRRSPAPPRVPPRRHVVRHAVAGTGASTSR